MKVPADAHERPRQPGKIRSVFLALAVHAAFFALIVFGVTWQSRPTPPLQAELWDKLPPGKPGAAPKAEPQPPKVEPPQAEPPKPEPPKAEPRPEPPKPDPAIAEKKEREKKERAKKEQERRELEKREHDRKVQETKAREAKAAAEAKAVADAKAKAVADAKAKAVAEARAKAEAEAQAKSAAEAATQARLSEIDRYRGRIRDKIRGKANVPDTVRGKPEVQVRITILPGGEVLDARIVRPSTNPAYDDAILRAIRSASPLPVPPASSELFPTFRDLMLNFEHER